MDAADRRPDDALRALAFAATATGVVVTDPALPDGPIVDANPAFERLTGYARAEVLGRNCRFLQGPGTDPGAVARVGAAVRDGREAAETLLNYRKDGTPFWNELRVTPVRGPRGALVHFVGVLADATDRVEADRDRARLAAIVDSSADAIIGKDLGGTVTSWNRAAEELYGYAAAEMVGAPIAAIVPPERLGELAEIMARLGRGERIAHHDTERRRKDGTRVPVSLSISPVRDAAGRVVGASTIARDISDRRRLDDLRRDYLAMVTHDLRTPLTGIRGHAQLMQRRGEYREAAVAAVVAQADRMQRLIDGLADVVRLEAGRLELRRAPVDLAGLARREAAALAAQAPGHALAVEAPGGLVVGAWDADRLGQVLQNLLGNAVKHAPDGGAVAVRVEAAAGQAKLSVRDDGPGIAPEHLPRLFERFYRADATGAGGLGLGLYITRMIVGAHGGTIAAESEPGGGSTFTVVLPVAGPTTAG